ncbi:hypothetical protein L6452_37352 [Arctium lappa]|uniref:Uncharacterized protein n=1 Tax=Arctium lappa TaxID=4217 RepID=A0ACB8Y490_ARCLA|nr:hypothetical protein L6452_37352 [Arctium lappa]
MRVAWIDSGLSMAGVGACCGLPRTSVFYGSRVQNGVVGLMVCYQKGGVRCCWLVTIDGGDAPGLVTVIGCLVAAMFP